MKRTEIAITILFPVYLSIVSFTSLSLVGYWTDIIAAIILSAISIRYVRKSKMPFVAKIVNTICFGSVFAFVAVSAITPFFCDQLKTRSFYFRVVDGRLFNAYFRPVGAYAGGYGQFWITETSKYFPLIEWQVFYDRTVNWDFGPDEYDGQPVDNVVRGYIKQEVIEKVK